MAELKIAVFASGGGTNLQALIDSIGAGKIRGRICAVISNNSGVYALERARAADIPAYHISSKKFPEPGEFVKALDTVLSMHAINLIVLAGYMRLLPTEIIRRFRGRIINIHPALLPRYGGRGMYGLNVHRAVLESGDRISGATVHLVDEIYDHGPILIQRTVPVLAGDTPETLAARVLEVEHRILPEAVSMFV
ncbi:MAG: phosphoribosylglycinamide formyltransferase [candidate division Zixibacteria bacterium RBG_16_53_22]|nr:MAG: phosphoribosylglycinamide formyltransferase [candidate division Zixibacteria bacterium RBG_16_53_22]